jgi:iron complex transport system substrate-binding protein
MVSGRSITLLLPVIFLALSVMTGSQTEAGSPRLVSLNLCADQYLLALAPTPSIVGLSRYARDSDLSYFARKARFVTATGSTIEELIALRPDLVVAGAFTSPILRQHAVRLRLKLATLGHPTSIEGVRRQIADLAARLGAVARGQAMIARIDRALRRLSDAGRPFGGKAALYLQRRGLTAGSGTLVDDLITKAGLVNAAARGGVKGVRNLTLEALLAFKPDIVIAGRDIQTPRDQGSALLHHRALRKAYRRAHRLLLPVAETVCPGPATAAAIETLADALERLQARIAR